MMKSYKLQRSFSRITRNRDYEFLQGVVFTPLVTVAVYTQGNGQSRNYTIIDFSYNGKHYRRTFKKRYTERGLARKANEFAREIIQ